MPNASKKFVRLSLAVAAAFVLAGSAAAQATRGSAATQSQYQQDRAACMSGQSGQDQATCLKEAGAARAEARSGNLSDGQGSLRRNARDRCNALTGADRSDCLARMKGEGTVSGSVKGGGMLREKVTIVPAPSSGTAGSAASAPK
ncbi:MAG: hypothetical protein M3Y67_06345 [Pseudomonadota bacterium]|nr:hypothetical protein [Pseudomonadota bacterium]